MKQHSWPKEDQEKNKSTIPDVEKSVRVTEEIVLQEDNSGTMPQTS